MAPGEKEFYTEAMADDEKTFVMIDTYRGHRKAISGGTKPHNTKFTVAILKQRLSKISAVDVLQKGRLMCKRRFCTWVSDRLFILCLSICKPSVHSVDRAIA